MAGKLGPSFGYLLPKQLLEKRNANILEVCHHPLPLSVEPADVIHAAITAKGHAQRFHQLKKQRKYVLCTVSMAVRINVCGHATEQAVEPIQLSMKLVAYRLKVI